jgi:hypothetical protein
MADQEEERKKKLLQSANPQGSSKQATALGLGAINLLGGYSG